MRGRGPGRRVVVLDLLKKHNPRDNGLFGVPAVLQGVWVRPCKLASWHERMPMQFTVRH